jgi:two-component SAPR family response regulator
MTTRARRWLGKAKDGGEYLHLLSAAKGYRLHPDLTCDWHDFLALACKGLDAGPDGIDDLTSALALVRGRPFHGIDPRDYAWAEPDIQEMISTITDVTLALADLHHHAGNHEGAQAAALRGLAAVPTNESLWQAAIQAARHRGDVHEEQRLIARRRTTRDLD